MNIFAGGQLNGRKPAIAPTNAKFQSQMGWLSGTAGATTAVSTAPPTAMNSAWTLARPSTPSMKLNRLTHQIPINSSGASSIAPLSDQPPGRTNGGNGGNTIRSVAHTPICTKKRTRAETGATSSRKPTRARMPPAPASANHACGCALCVATHNPETTPATAIPTPPPPGVGTSCDER
ncbi:hypothetical protein D3C72_1240350 [compost metagenome]